MKINLNTDKFIRLIAPLQSIINPGHTMPILQEVKLDFEGKVLTATGENLEINCKNEISIENEISTSFCANFSMLLAIVKSITDTNFTMSIIKEKSIIKISHKKGDFEIPTSSSNEFPSVTIDAFEKSAKLDSSIFKSALKVANKFISDDDLTAMCNVSISVGKQIFVRSTDRNRLFEERVQGSGDEANLLINGKCSVALFSLIELAESIKMKFNEDRVLFKFKGTEITVLQQKGDFPLVPFKGVIDCIDDALPVKVDIKELLTTLKRVSILSTREKSPTVKTEFTKNLLMLSCQSFEYSTKSEEYITIKSKVKRVTGYNYKFLIEILSVFGKDAELFINEKNLLFIKQGKKKGAVSPVNLDH